MEQIIAKLREAEKLQGQGLTIPQARKRLQTSDQTFYARASSTPEESDSVVEITDQEQQGNLATYLVQLTRARWTTRRKERPEMQQTLTRAIGIALAIVVVGAVVAAGSIGSATGGTPSAGISSERGKSLRSAESSSAAHRKPKLPGCSGKQLALVGKAHCMRLV